MKSRRAAWTLLLEEPDVALTPGVVDTSSAIKVMGIGDSLTAGLPADTYLSYRGALLRRMGELGHAIQFVGNTNRGERTEDGWTFLNKYNANGGYDTATIQTAMPPGMREGYPEIAVLCAGANDIAGTTPADIVTEVEALIDEILTYPQLQYLFVTDVTLNTGYVSQCTAFNSLLKTAVEAYGDNVIFVKCFADAELADNVHPTAAAWDAIGVTLAEAIAEVFPVTSISDNSPRQYRKTSDDWWLSTRDYAGTGVGPIYSDTAWSTTATHGDNVATLTDLIHLHQFSDSPTGPEYDDGESEGTADVGPVMDFATEGGVLTDSLGMGTPLTFFVVGEFDSGDTSGSVMQFDTGSPTRVVLNSETPGAPAGFGFFDGAYKGFGAAGAEFGEFAVFAVRYQADGYARLYKNGVQIGNDVAYDSWGEALDIIAIGANTAQYRFADMVCINAELSDTEFAALNGYLETRNGL